MIDLSPDQIDVLRELINIGVGRSMSTLHDLLHSHILMEVPTVQVLSVDQARSRFKVLGLETVSTVNFKFDGPFSGVSSLLFTPESAEQLVSLLISGDDDYEDVDSVRIGILMEVGNIVLNSVMGSFGNSLGKHFSFTVPEYFEGPGESLLKQHAGGTSAVLLSTCVFRVESSRIVGHINLIFDIASLDSLIASIDELTEDL